MFYPQLAVQAERYFSLSILKILFHCVLAFIVADAKFSNSPIVVPLQFILSSPPTDFERSDLVNHWWWCAITYMGFADWRSSSKVCSTMFNYSQLMYCGNWNLCILEPCKVKAACVFLFFTYSFIFFNFFLIVVQVQFSTFPPHLLVYFYYSEHS